MLTRSPLLGKRVHQDEKEKIMDYFVAYAVLITSMLGMVVALHATVKFKDTFYVVSVLGFYLMSLVGLTMVDALGC
jgi:predicted tellurium resistance membrane protein TerC